MPNIILHGANGSYLFDPEDRESWIGEGGMGRVFKGEQKETQKKVAIKVLFREFTSNRNNVERFKLESTIKIRHRNLIEMIDFIEEDGKFHIISEYLEGEVLSQKIEKLNKSGQTIEADEAKKIILAVAEGLELLHKNNIIHRDIKPSNIILLSDGGIKLFDYGVIKKGEEGIVNKLTRDGSFVGSYQYAPPEQIRNIDKASINQSSDIYSLGITLYELLTGKVPFDGSSEYEIMDKHTKEIIPVNTKLNRGYYNLITNATAKDQKYRYKTIIQFRDDLLKLPNGNVQLIRSGWARSRGFKITLAATILVIAAAFAFYFITQKQNREHYATNMAKAEKFYSIAQYDSARAYYNKALTYIEVDSTKSRSSILNIFIPAMQAFYSAQYKKAFDEFKKAADLGSGDAYYYLGELTFNGIGTTKDYKKGWEYTNKAAEKGFKMAYWRIAFACESGKGVPKDQDKADKYYLEAIEGMKKLAEGGDPEALGNLGSMYAAGSGVSRNKKMAFEYYLKSAKAGYAFIMSTLGDMYRYGEGTSRNMDEAVKWYTKSANLGHPTAQLLLGNLYLWGEGVDKDVNKGLELINKAASQNYSGALSKLGYLYYVGEGVPRDYKRSFEYTKKAIEYDNDNTVAIENLAFDYTQGTGTEKNYKIARDYYLKAIGTDSSRYLNYLKIAKLYAQGGYGLTKSESEFVRYCELAEDGGVTEATRLLGIYYNSKGYEAFRQQEYSRAKAYFILGSGKGNTQARNNYNYMTDKGY